MTESDTTLNALFINAMETDSPEDRDALIQAWKTLCQVLDTAEHAHGGPL